MLSTLYIMKNQKKHFWINNGFTNRVLQLGPKYSLILLN